MDEPNPWPCLDSIADGFRFLVFYNRYHRRFSRIVHRAGLTIVPFMPWHKHPPPLSGAPRGHLLIFFYHIMFYNYGSIRVWIRIVLPDFTSLKSTGHFFIKGGPLIQGHKIGCPREHLLNFTLRYGYSLWYDVIFVDNINVLNLALWAEKILKLNVFLCNLKKNAYTVVNCFLGK